MSKPYTARTWPERLAIMKELEACNSMMHQGHVGNGFVAAIGRDSFAVTDQAIRAHGFECAELYNFPLGTDKPAEHLRHDSRGFPSCCWLLAWFEQIFCQASPFFLPPVPLPSPAGHTPGAPPTRAEIVRRFPRPHASPSESSFGFLPPRDLASFAGGTTTHKACRARVAAT